MYLGVEPQPALKGHICWRLAGGKLHRVSGGIEVLEVVWGMFGLQGVRVLLTGHQEGRGAESSWVKGSLGTLALGGPHAPTELRAAGGGPGGGVPDTWA